MTRHTLGTTFALGDVVPPTTHDIIIALIVILAVVISGVIYERRRQMSTKYYIAIAPNHYASVSDDSAEHAAHCLIGDWEEELADDDVRHIQTWEGVDYEEVGELELLRMIEAGEAVDDEYSYDDKAIYPTKKLKRYGVTRTVSLTLNT